MKSHRCHHPTKIDLYLKLCPIFKGTSQMKKPALPISTPRDSQLDSYAVIVNSMKTMWVHHIPSPIDSLSIGAAIAKEIQVLLLVR